LIKTGLIARAGKFNREARDGEMGESAPGDCHWSMEGA